MNTSSAAFVDAYIGLGSNLENPRVQVDFGLSALSSIADTEFVASSSLYTSQPMGPQDQPDFVNAVAKIRTALEPHALLAELHRIEHQRGRERLRHWGPRTLDLDLLIYGDQSIQTETLSVPHPGVPERSFVLLPLHEVAGDNLLIQGMGCLRDLLDKLDCRDLHRLS